MPGGTNAPHDEPRAILIVRPSALGDVCRSVPVLVSLRRRFPRARIDWLVQDSFVDAVAAHPDLIARGGRALPFPRRELRRWYTPAGAARALRWMNGALRAARYDLVVDAQGLFRSGLFSWWTRAGVRVGYAGAPEHASIFYTRRIDAPMSLHAVERMLRLVEGAGAEPVRDMRLYTPARDRALAASLGLDNRRYVLLAPTTRWASKGWAPERYAELAERLLDDRTGGVDTVAVVGTAGERGQIAPLLDRAAKDTRFVDLTARTSVGQLMALVESAALVVGSDSAAVHVAVGFDRPLVALYGPTDVSRVGPYRRESCVVQNVGPGDRLDHKDPANRALMDRITVDDACAAARRALAGASRPV
jgi:heptosyltransferase I